MTDEELKQVWLAFASSAISGMGGSGSKKINLDDIIEDAVEVADDMLIEYCRRWDPKFVEPPEPEEDEEEPTKRRRR